MAKHQQFIHHHPIGTFGASNKRPITSHKIHMTSARAYVGCFNDGFVRVLPTNLYYQQPGYQTCFDQALSLGYRYVGLEAWNIGNQGGTNTGECWGGNSLTTAESQGVASNCAQVITTDGSVIWAGGGAIALYDLSLGPITTYAGTGVSGNSGDYGAATISQLNSPWGVTADKSGNVYISDSSNQKIRLVSSIGIITTYAGTHTHPFIQSKSQSHTHPFPPFSMCNRYRNTR